MQTTVQTATNTSKRHIITSPLGVPVFTGVPRGEDLSGKRHRNVTETSRDFIDDTLVGLALAEAHALHDMTDLVGRTGGLGEVRILAVKNVGCRGRGGEVPITHYSLLITLY